MIHPTNHLERLKAKEKHERKSASKEEKAGRVWRKRTKEEVKEKETEDELHLARDYFG